MTDPNSAATGAGDIEVNYEYNRGWADAVETCKGTVDALRQQIAASRQREEALRKALQRIDGFYHAGIDDRTFAGCAGTVLDEIRAALAQEDGR